MGIAASEDGWDAQLRGVLGERITLLATHQAIDQGEIHRLVCKKEPRLFCGCRTSQPMAEGNEKLGYD
jgi:hypothetical protein